ncbi:FAD-dependent oxidoreductase [Roseibium sp. M-1]
MNTMAGTIEYDVLIVGAGPAGMTASVDCAAKGARVLVVDENSAAGGQIYRAAGGSPMGDRKILGSDYWRGRDLIERFEASKAQFCGGTTVWMIEAQGGGEEDGSVDRQGFVIGLSAIDGSGQETARLLLARSVLIATGALERPFPIPGWTLPGVMTAGAGQTFLKSSGVVPQGPTVLAGSGPLLYLLAAQYARANVEISALLDTTPRGNLSRAAAKIFDFVQTGNFWKGMSLLATVHRHNKIVRGVTSLKANGTNTLSSVTYEARSTKKEINARTLLLHQGVVPQVNLTMAAGCRHNWNERRLAFEPQLDSVGHSSVSGLFVAGDTAGINGAAAAECAGHIVAMGISAFLDPRGSTAIGLELGRLQKAYRAHLKGREFLEAYYKPAAHFRMPADGVVVCRCEGVTAGTIRALARQGAQGPNQAKAFCRAGMGACQGRLCGLSVSELIAAEKKSQVSEIGHYHIRNPVKPVTVAALAGTVAEPLAEEAKKRRLF